MLIVISNTALETRTRLVFPRFLETHNKLNTPTKNSGVQSRLGTKRFFAIINQVEFLERVIVAEQIIGRLLFR